ncbi:hypothetical protein PSYAE_27054, partial [Pseudomonas amygdali pv. aesculi str. 0893_23]
LGRRDVGFTLFNPFQLAIPCGEFGWWQWDDFVDLGDLWIGVGQSIQYLANLLVALSTVKIFFLIHIVHAIIGLRITKYFA